MNTGLPRKPRFWGALRLGAMLLYVLLALAQILARPGFQYDEALLVLGSVHMRQGTGELPLPHDPDTWLCPGDHCFPLMTVMYVGAVKEWLCLPLFAVFPWRAGVVRIVSMLLGLVGIWGVSRLTVRAMDARAGALTALLIGLNPAYVAFTVFDNGTVAIFMASMGLAAAALGLYASRKNASSAFLLGAAAAFGVWGRANFAWLLAAVLAGCVFAYGKRILLPVRHWAAMAGGAVAGGVPLLIYEVISRGGTLAALGLFADSRPLFERVLARLPLLFETLLSDTEHRVMWGGSAMPVWQLYLFPAVVAASTIAAILFRKGFPRACAIALIVLSALLLTSRLPVAQHHLVSIVPLAAAVVASTWLAPGANVRWVRIAGAALLSVYLASAAVWQSAAIQGLRETGGIGPWSDAVYRLADDLERLSPQAEVKILDWGLQNNLYVLSDGRIRSREIYGSPISSTSEAQWLPILDQGGLYLTTGPEFRNFPETTGLFERVLAAGRFRAVRTPYRQRDGRVAAELISVAPGSRNLGSPQVPAAPGRKITLTMADPALGAAQGFHRLEENGWRWTARRFSAAIGNPSVSHPLRLTLKLYFPEAVLSKLGPVTLSAYAGGHKLSPETFSSAGPHAYTRTLTEGSGSTAVQLQFTLDKALAPNATDPRELGMIVSSIELETF